MYETPLPEKRPVACTVSPYLVRQPAKALAVLNGQAANSMKNEQTTRCTWAVNIIILKYVYYIYYNIIKYYIF